MQQGNSPSYKLPVFVSPQAGDKGMRLFQKNTATLPWKRLLLVLYSPSVQQPEFSVASSYAVLDLNLVCAHPSRFLLLFPLFLLFLALGADTENILASFSYKERNPCSFILRAFLNEQDGHGWPTLVTSTTLLSPNISRWQSKPDCSLPLYFEVVLLKIWPVSDDKCVIICTNKQGWICIRLLCELTQLLWLF